MNPTIVEFQKRVKDIESAYKSARIRSLLIDRGQALVPCVTRIDLQPSEPDNTVNEFWPSKSLRVVEVGVEYTDIGSIMKFVMEGTLSIDGIQLGLGDSDNCSWYYDVFYRGEGVREVQSDSTVLRLRGVLPLEELPSGHLTKILNEVRLHKTLPFPSLESLVRRFFGLSEVNTNLNLVDIYAPSRVQILSLRYVGSEVIVRFKCMRETANDVRIKATFTTTSGQIHPYPPRLRQSPVKELADGAVEVTKSFPVPDEAVGSIGVDLTLSLKGKSGLDTAYAYNLPIVNPVWHVLEQLDRTKVGRHFDMDSFEQRITHMNNDDIFEAMIASLLSSCGFQVVWIGGFGLSAQDLLAFDTISNPILICECTVGSPRHKVGLMKTALSTISSRVGHFRFAGVVFTSQPIGDAERQGALKDSVIIRDVEDIKTLVQMSTDSPDTERVYSWLGIETG